MNSEEKQLKNAERLLEQAGYTVPQLIQAFGKYNSKMLMLGDADYSKFAMTYEQLKQSDLDKTEKGKRLEELATILFEKSVTNIFDVYRNCRTSTNEIDILLRWSEHARMSAINTAFPCFGESFLCECKNYNGKVDVTYVVKFCSLMLVTGTNLGIMVSWDGVTGRGSWSDSKGLIKKIALKENKYIVVIDKNDLCRIYNKEASIFSMIYDKYLALQTEVDYSKYILKHDAELDLGKIRRGL